MTDGHLIELGGASLVARASGALWWPEARLLCVADLHLGRSERLARRGGGLLPPYETRATLERLAGEIAALAPSEVVCLGDSFDDCAAGAALGADAARALAGMLAGRGWTWIAGNHDPAPPPLGGAALAELGRGPLVFRHAAAPASPAGEVSGHYHPKLRLATRAGTVSRPCFLTDGRRLILPAFGAYTGGLGAEDPVFAGLLGPGAEAILTGAPPVALPLGAALRRRFGRGPRLGMPRRTGAD